MTSEEFQTLLSLGGTGGSLIVRVKPIRPAGAIDAPWFDTEIEVDAFAFHGTLKTIFTGEDFRQWSRELHTLSEGVGRAVLGGGRAAQLIVETEHQIGGRKVPNSVVALVDLTPSGDDPYPRLQFLIFDLPPSWPDAHIAMAEVLGLPD